MVVTLQFVAEGWGIIICLSDVAMMLCSSYLHEEQALCSEISRREWTFLMFLIVCLELVHKCLKEIATENFLKGFIKILLQNVFIKIRFGVIYCSKGVRTFVLNICETLYSWLCVFRRALLALGHHRLHAPSLSSEIIELQQPSYTLHRNGFNEVWAEVVTHVHGNTVVHQQLRLFLASV